MCVQVADVHFFGLLLFLSHLLCWSVFDKICHWVLCSKLLAGADLYWCLSWFFVGSCWSVHFGLCLYSSAYFLLWFEIHNDLWFLCWRVSIILCTKNFFCVVPLHENRLIFGTEKGRVSDKDFHFISAKFKQGFEQVNDHKSIIGPNDGFDGAKIDRVWLLVEEIDKQVDVDLVEIATVIFSRFIVGDIIGREPVSFCIFFIFRPWPDKAYLVQMMCQNLRLVAGLGSLAVEVLLAVWVWNLIVVFQVSVHDNDGMWEENSDLYFWVDYFLSSLVLKFLLPFFKWLMTAFSLFWRCLYRSK